MNLLLGPDCRVTTAAFAMDELLEALEDEVRQMTNMKVVDDLLQHLGVDLALRCLHSEPHLQRKESANRELEVVAKYSISDNNATGSVDFLISLKQFGISVVEGKLHDTMKEHEGQLFASMRVCREQYLKKQKLKKRKRDADPMTQVPSVGILSNGTGYLFYKCCHNGQQNGQPVLECSEFMHVNLLKGTRADAAVEEVKKVVQTMVKLFRDQKVALTRFWEQRNAPK